MGIQIGASSVWKTVSNFAVGSGGLWKGISKGWVGAGGVWKQFWGNTVGSTSAFQISSASSGGTSGYVRGSLGSITSGATLPDGKVIKEVSNTSSNSNLRIDGFTADPGNNYIAQISINTVTKAYNTATYTWTGGTGEARWLWSTPTFNLLTGPYNGTITF